MRKKELAALPVMKTKSQKRILAARVDGDTLVIDGYDEGKYMGRYCLRNTGEYMSLVDGVWRQQKLTDMLNGYTRHPYWGSYSSTYASCLNSEQDELVRSYLEAMEGRDYSNIQRCINSVEERAVADKRERAEQRRLERICKRMECVPCLPDGFVDWCKAVPFGGKQYMFLERKQNKYYCTACGKTHQLKTAKNGKPVLCSRTGKEVMVDKVRSVRTEECHAMVLQFTASGERVARHFRVESIWNPYEQKVFAYEQVRYMLKTTGCNEWYYGQRNLASEDEQRWDEHNPKNFHCFREYCYPEGVAAVLAGTVYEHLGIQEMAAAGWRVWYNKLMHHYYHCGAYEYLVKGGYRRLAEEGSSWPSGWMRDGNTVSAVLGIDKQRANRLRQANGGMAYLHWMRREQKTGCRIPERAVQWLEQHRLCDDIQFILDRMSPEQVVNYLERQQKQSGKGVSWLLDEWRDLLRMAEQFDMDTADPIVYRPKDMVEAHDRLVVKLHEETARKTEQDYEERFPGLSAVCGRLKKYEWSDGEYAVVAPSCINDILVEGQVLHHCGTSDRYFERIAKEESYILFLRRATAPDIPWYTLEVEPGGVIRQKRTKFNRQEKDLEAAKDFLKRWQQEIIKRVGEREWELQKKAATARKQEIAQLRKNGVIVHGGELTGTLLADVLLGDLMEIAG